MKRACLSLSGFVTCPHYKQAKLALQGLSVVFPTQLSVEVNEREIFKASQT